MHGHASYGTAGWPCAALPCPTGYHDKASSDGTDSLMYVSISDPSQRWTCLLVGSTNLVRPECRDHRRPTARSGPTADGSLLISLRDTHPCCLYCMMIWTSKPTQSQRFPRPLAGNMERIIHAYIMGGSQSRSSRISSSNNSSEEWLALVIKYVFVRVTRYACKHRQHAY